jgi:hypothetical protein
LGRKFTKIPVIVPGQTSTAQQSSHPRANNIQKSHRKKKSESEKRGGKNYAEGSQVGSTKPARRAKKTKKKKNKKKKQASPECKYLPDPAAPPGKFQSVNRRLTS